MMDLDVRDKDGKLESHFHKEDITLVQLALAIQEALMAVSTNFLKDIGGVSHAISAGSAGTAPRIAFGIGTTPAAFSDFSIQTTAGASSDIVSASVAVMVNNAFVVTATWTNTTGGSISITELSMYVTIATFTFALTHDVFPAQPVSAGGTATATLTFSFN